MRTDKAKQEKWSQIVAACKSSGLAIKTYCRENHINYPQYQYWSDVLSQAKPVIPAGQVEKAKPGFIPIAIAPNAQGGVVDLPELFLRVGGFEVLIRRVS